MKVLNKIKSIYLLAVIAILSFCMLLFPAMPKTASADSTMGAGDFQITGIEVSVQTFTDDDGETYDKWAIMFQASIAEEEYNNITLDGTVDVKFGILVGLTSRADGISELSLAEIIAPKAQGGRSFQFFTYSANQIVFKDGVAVISGGIVYNQKALTEGNQDLIATANKSLTAIPFYMVGDVSVVDGVKTINSTEYDVLFDNQKNAIPRNYLAASYISPNPDNLIPVKEETVNAFAGGIIQSDDEAYICRSTNRVMVEKKSENDDGDLVSDGTLVPANLAVNNSSSLVLFGEENLPILVKGGATAEDTDLLDENVVKTLAKYGEGTLITFGDQIIAYNNAKIAERVITRFADTKIGDAVADETDDYLAVAGTSAYTSIFAVNNDATNMYLSASSTPTSKLASGSSPMVYLTMDKGFDGLYVLANKITFDGEYKVYTGSSLESQLTTCVAGSRTLMSLVIPIYGLGFNGVFDGRGLSIDANSKANQGIFPSAFDATVKNTAFLGLTQTSDGGGIMSQARASRFENIYAVVASVSNGKADLNKGILMNVEDCDFKNFIAKVDVADDLIGNAMPTSNLAGAVNSGATATGTGYGQSASFNGVFSFRAYTDMFYDSTLNDGAGGVRYMMAYNTGANVAEFTTEIIKQLGAAEVERLFPNSIIIKDGAESISRFGFNDGLNSNVNPSPFTKNSTYNGTVDGGVRKYADQLHDAFVGSTGENVYAIGSSPLYLAHQFTENAANISLDKTTQTKTTVFVNEAPDLADGSGKADINWKNGVAPTAYAWQDIAGDMFKIEFTDANGAALDQTLLKSAKADKFLSLGEIIVYGKVHQSTAGKFLPLIKKTGTASGNNLANILINYRADLATQMSVQFVNKAGFYDVATEADMAGYVQAQATPFDSAFWNVVDGVVSWKNL